MYVWFVSNPVVCVENINADIYLDTLIYNISFINGCLIKGEIRRAKTFYIKQPHLYDVIYDNT